MDYDGLIKTIGLCVVGAEIIGVGTAITIALNKYKKEKKKSEKEPQESIDVLERNAIVLNVENVDYEIVKDSKGNAVSINVKTTYSLTNPSFREPVLKRTINDSDFGKSKLEHVISNLK
ncbi:MAG: hypothetical protein AABW47_01730 [Nanoarchaeota archaeon]